MEFERRFAGIELRAEGRRLSGTVLRYGDVSPSHRERFEPGALRLAEAVHLDLAHDPERAVAWHPGGGLHLDNGRQALTMRAELPPLPAADRALAEVRAGRANGLSVEFRALAERREGGLRVAEESDERLGAIGAAASAMVEQYAPGAPAELKNEAIIRFAGYLAEAPAYRDVAKSTVGPLDVEYAPNQNHGSAFRNSGAAMLLSRWRVRRAGAIG